MVYNCFIKCQVCGSITRICLQVGWQNEHPVVVTCGKCGTSLSGYVKIGQSTPSLEFDFDNADMISKADKADYMVECSGEFSAIKQCEFNGVDDIIIMPFIKAMNCMKDENLYENFGEVVSQLNTTAVKWKDYKRILDLFQNKSEYLVQEIKKEFKGEYFQCRDESEILRAVHMIEVHGFYSSLKREILDDLSFSSDILKLDSIQMKKMINFLNTHDGHHLDEMQALIYKLYGAFVDVFQALIPALLLQYCKDGAYDFEIEGSTTSTFDTVKQFYLDVYEALGNLLVIPVALNNVKYRADVEKLASVEKNAVFLEDFVGLTKATRYHFYLKNEIYRFFGCYCQF